MELKGKKVAVLGLGKSGIAAAKLLHQKEAKVFISEINNELSFKGELYSYLNNNFEIELGRHSEKILESDMIVISPGINTDIPIIKKAHELNISVISEIELAFKFIKNQTLVSITGTNGKTTVTTLLGEVVKNDKKETIVAGNIGYPLCEAINELKEEHILITEISSFQLENIEKFKPHISVLLNITEDHLDRYFDMEEYTRAKKNITINQKRGDFIVLNYDDFRIRSLDIRTSAKIIYFSVKEKIKEGVYIEDNKIISNLKGKKEFICNLEDIKIKGKHNQENILAVVSVSILLNVNKEILKDTISNFAGLEHRIKEVKNIHGVTFINDSKATNIDAMLKAMESFNSPIILIAGGRDKKGNFILLRNLLLKKTKEMILIGESKEKIRNLLKECVNTHLVDNLSKAVNLAYALAEDGDIVLFSPGCSSYDMFSNYEERGECFKKEVFNLASRVGEKVGVSL
ncbi:MAG: UDP-N-acetylmuramoyl-L-alanine--D-glutamate ligase [bacterium]|nr:UDP-N-acetylmuramoyl-L-alanine--D-glutamate ligase [bacterium]